MSELELLTPKEVADLIRCTPDAVRQFVARYPDFPRKIKLSPGPTGRVRYRASEVRAWIAVRATASNVGAGSK